MKYILPTARAAKRPYPGARLYTLVPTARENPDVVNAHRFPATTRRLRRRATRAAASPPSVADVVREPNIRTEGGRRC